MNWELIILIVVLPGIEFTLGYLIGYWRGFVKGVDKAKAAHALRDF